MRAVAWIACLCLLVSCGNGREEATGNQTLRGSLRLIDVPDFRGVGPVAGGANVQPGDACRGSRVFRDYDQGGRVTVRGPDLDIIGVGSLEEGILMHAREPFGTEYDYCEFAFTVENLPEVGFYSLEVVELEFFTFTRSYLEANSWMVVLVVPDFSE